MQVRLETQDILLSRDAPNRLTLSTPWGKVQAKLTGTAQRNPEFAAYYAQVRPVTLAAKVPATAKAGVYTGQFEAELFVCDKVDKMCLPRTVRGNVRLNVGNAAKAAVLTLKDAQLRPKRLNLSPKR